MDGRGRCLDNIFIERLWRSLKHEYLYLYQEIIDYEIQNAVLFIIGVDEGGVITDANVLFTGLYSSEKVTLRYLYNLRSPN